MASCIPNKPRILVVDDHAVVRKGVRSLLEKSGWTVCGEAANGKDAIEQAMALKPDLVLMDISMPVMNGIEATRQMRKLSPETRVIILSMHDAPQIEQQAKEAGADAVLVKSGSVEDLHKTLLKVLRQPRE